nr:ribonuclease H-like domain-containing protein [Tanacetum cinerariifolium]
MSYLSKYEEIDGGYVAFRGDPKGGKITEKLNFSYPYVHGNPQQELQEKGVIDSGCSRHMTGNMSYLSKYEEIDGGYVAFRGDPKGGKITGKVLTDIAALEEVCLAVLSVLRPELVKAAFRTKFLFELG